ncbi:MAG: hypothetical protein R3F42_08605 [Pseudomonadota bacterium]
MRKMYAIAYAGAAVLLFGCEQQHTPDLDPEVGIACFEAHRFTLTPGTQYEGIDRLTSEAVRIKIMDGVRVATIECPLNPDGTLR